MLTSSQIHGALLEEAVLHLLRNSGYSTVDNPAGDPTLVAGGAGLFVRGRGGNHQIDAIADFLVPQPFTNPSRLLVEAKCYFRRNVRLPEVRNSVGVLKDVTEYWVPAASEIHRRRYHYQAAMASASDFSNEAQEYAFAQDIYLLPLGKSVFFRPILRAIRMSVPRGFKVPKDRVSKGVLRAIRDTVRGHLRNHHLDDLAEVHSAQFYLNLRPFISACRNLNYILLGILGGQFPIVLAPSPAMQHGDLPTRIPVRIYWDHRSWYLGPERNRPLFSFDLPRRLFQLYETDGELTRRRALDLKADFMALFQAIQTIHGRVKIITFELDQGWLDQLRRHTQ